MKHKFEGRPIEKTEEYFVRTIDFKTPRTCLNSIAGNCKNNGSCKNKIKRGYYIDIWKKNREEYDKLSIKERKKELGHPDKNYWSCAECLAKMLVKSPMRLQFIWTL